MKKQKNEFKIVIISFGIIALVVILMFFKINLKEKNTEQKNVLETQKEVDKIKSAKSINAAELLQRIQSKENITIIDIRSADEFEKEHLINSINLSSATINENISKLDKSLTYVLIDNTNTLEVMDLVSSSFAEKDIVNAYYLNTGLAGWKNNFYPTVSAGNPESIIDQSKINYINTDELKALIEKEKNLLIIDVRDKNSFNTERIPKSINIALSDIEKKIKEIPIGKQVIVYDDNSFLAFSAAVRLFDLGRKRTFTLSDGFIKWKEKNYPIEK